MKIITRSQKTALVCLGLLTIHSGSAWAQGTVVRQSIVFGQPWAGPPGTYLMANAYPSGPNGGFFALSLSTIGPGDYQLGYYGIAELYSVHGANFGMAFTPDYVAGDPPLLSNNNNPGTHQFSLGPGQSRTFAYWDDALWFGNPPSTEALQGVPDYYDAYGWFRLTRQGSELVISDSATAMGGGIIVGTYTAVPEPASFALGLVGAFVIMMRRRR